MKKLKEYPQVLFLGVVIVLSLLFYNGFSDLTRLPMGIHQWKQSMNFSIAKNLSDSSASFFHPAMDNLFNSDNTGRLVLEFPVIHWLASFFMPTFPFAFRIITFIILLAGIFLAFRLVYTILNDYVLSSLVVLLFFTIPIIIFYGASYLVDVPAMIFGIAAVYFWEQYRLKLRGSYFIYGAILFTLSGLLRLPVLIFPLAYFGGILLTKFKQGVKVLLWLLPSFAIIFAWYFYVKKVNTYYVSYPPIETYFFLSPDKIKSTWKAIDDFMVYQLGFVNRFVFLYLLGFVAFIVYRKSINRFWFRVFIVSAIGSTVYFLLWFGIFEQHDYYIIPILPTILLFWLNIAIVMAKVLPRRVVVLVFTLAVLLNVINEYDNIQLRNFHSRVGWTNFMSGNIESGVHFYFRDEDYNKWAQIRKMSPFSGSKILEDNGIVSGDTVICNFDYSPSYSLSILNLKGWSLYNSRLESLADYKRYIGQGAKYLISLRNESALADSLDNSTLKKHLRFRYKNIEVYYIGGIK